MKSRHSSAVETIYFSENADTPKKIVSVESITGDDKFEWTPRVMVSDEDNKSLERNMSQLRVTKFGKITHLLAWKVLTAHNNPIFKKLAIYDTKECGYGLRATDDICEHEILPYPGKLTIIDKDKAIPIEDLVYSYSLSNLDDRVFANINGKNFRHYATYAMHAWHDKSELEKYTFASNKIKNSVATANASMIVVSRPSSISDGPAISIGLLMMRDIQKNEPILHDYGQHYFPVMKNSISERFFDRFTGMTIDKSLHQASEVNLIVHSNRTYFGAGIPAGLWDNNLPIPICSGSKEVARVENKDVRAALKKFPGERFISLDANPLAGLSIFNPSRNPAYITDSQKSLGLILRQYVANEKVSAQQVDKWLSSQDKHTVGGIINLTGGESGLTALHRAALGLSVEKIRVLVKHGADVTLLAKGKTAFDLAKANDAGSEVLEVLGAGLQTCISR